MQAGEKEIMFENLKYMVQPHVDKLRASVKRLLREERALQDAVGIVQALVAIVVVGAIGIFIADETVTTTGTPSNENLSAMQTSLLGAGQTGSSFIVILVIAFIGGIAMAYMFGMFGRGKK